MAYHRGTKGSHQLWAEAVGDQDYSFEKMLPYYQKSIRFVPPNMNLRFANSTPQYDTAIMDDGGGPLSVTFPNYAQGFASWATAAFLSMGIQIIRGFQSGSLLGQSYSMTTINVTTMTRDSSETSFMRRALDYPNFMIYQSTMAKKIVFSSNKRATGVIVETQGRRYTLEATREIIVSAGVFGSPQLLLVSGVGPAETLRNLGISVIADRPGVGQNMQDHISFGPSYRVNEPTMSALQDASFAARAAKEFNDNASGMLTNPTSDILAWEKLPEQLRKSLSSETLRALNEYPADWPELEFIAKGTYLGYQFKPRGGDARDGYNYASVAVVPCTPRSRGNLTIKSADNSIPPTINPNLFSDKADIEIAIAGYKRVRQFWNSTVLKPFLVGTGEAFPGLNIATDAQLGKIIKQSFNSISHAACTCKMGRPSDPSAVVDSHGRVYGVQGLRVVDASILPFLPPGHLMATICMFVYFLSPHIVNCSLSKVYLTRPWADAIAEKLACKISGNCG